MKSFPWIGLGEWTWWHGNDLVIQSESTGGNGIVGCVFTEEEGQGEDYVGYNKYLPYLESVCFVIFVFIKSKDLTKIK